MKTLCGELDGCFCLSTRVKNRRQKTKNNDGERPHSPPTHHPPPSPLRCLCWVFYFQNSSATRIQTKAVSGKLSFSYSHSQAPCPIQESTFLSNGFPLFSTPGKGSDIFLPFQQCPLKFNLPLKFIQIITKVRNNRQIITVIHPQ